MTHYFQAKFKDKDADIYIVRVDGRPWRAAKAIAEDTITK